MTNNVIWNINDKSPLIQLSADGYTASATGSTVSYSNHQSIRSGIAIPSYMSVFEVTLVSITQNMCIGIANEHLDLSINLGGGSDPNSIAIYPSTGQYSQPPNSIYSNNNALIYDSSYVTALPGDIVTVIVHMENVWFTTDGMRKKSGVVFNGSTTADPIKHIGGFDISSIGSPRYPFFNTSEGGSEVIINGGNKPFSKFLTDYMNIILPLSGIIPVLAPPIVVSPPTASIDILGGFILDNAASVLG